MDAEGGILSSFNKLTYQKARQLVLIVGLAVLLITAGVMYVRRVETVEVIGTLLFIPVLISFVFYGLKGGILAGIGAGIVYGSLRYPAISAVGAGRFTGLISSRTVAYILFGAIGGWADKQLEASLTKLELYDQIDDYTGLFNARFFVQDTDLELSRSKRYQTVFSVSLVSFPVAPLQDLTRRQRQTIRKELGRMLEEAVRTVDRAAHGFDGTVHRFACVLPETGPDGSRIFTERLADRIRAYLVERGVRMAPEQVNAQWFTFPDDGEEGIQDLRATFLEIDRHEHPDAAAGASAAPPAAGGSPSPPPAG